MANKVVEPYHGHYVIVWLFATCIGYALCGVTGFIIWLLLRKGG
jgi:preprotein translocase subunit Sss1